MALFRKVVNTVKKAASAVVSTVKKVVNTVVRKVTGTNSSSTAKSSSSTTSKSTSTNTTQSASKGTTNKSDSSAYWSAQKDASSGGNNNSKTSSGNGSSSGSSKGSSSSSSSSSGSSNGNGYPNTYGQQSNGAVNKAQIEEYELMRRGIREANEALTSLGSNLVKMIKGLGDSFSGEKAQSLIKTLNNNVDEINTVGNQLNNIGNIASQKEREIGGNPDITNDKLYTSFQTPQNRINEGIYRCDVKAMKNVESNEAKAVTESLNKVKDIISRLPQNLPGCEGIKKVISQISDTESMIQSSNKGLTDSIYTAEKMENQNMSIVDSIKNWTTNTLDKIENKVNNVKEVIATGITILGVSMKLAGQHFTGKIENKNKAQQQSFSDVELEHLLDSLPTNKDKNPTNQKENPIKPTVPPKLDLEENPKKPEKHYTEPEEHYTEIPVFNQKDSEYYNKDDGATIRESGCGLVALSMVMTYLRDEYVSPEKLAEEYYGPEYFNKSGTNEKTFAKEANKYGINVTTINNYEDAIKNGGVMNALENGQPVIARVGNGTTVGRYFTGSAHYIVLEGLTEDGKIKVKDPNGANYDKDGPIRTILTEGLTQAQLNVLGGTYYVFDAKETKSQEQSEEPFDIPEYTEKRGAPLE